MYKLVNVWKAQHAFSLNKPGQGEPHLQFFIPDNCSMKLLNSNAKQKKLSPPDHHVVEGEAKIRVWRENFCHPDLYLYFLLISLPHTLKNHLQVIIISCKTWFVKINLMQHISKCIQFVKWNYWDTHVIQLHRQVQDGAIKGDNFTCGWAVLFHHAETHAHWFDVWT